MAGKGKEQVRFLVAVVSVFSRAVISVPYSRFFINRPDCLSTIVKRNCRAFCHHEIISGNLFPQNSSGVVSTGKSHATAAGKIVLDDSFNGSKGRASGQHRAAAGNDPT